MTPQQEIDLKVAGNNLGRCIEEIIFCTVHPTLTGPHRREIAINTFGESIVTLIKQAKQLTK